MRIAADVKNLALYRGGIAQFFAPLLAHWIAERPSHRFVLLGPPFDAAALPASGHWEHRSIAWPAYLPRQARHPFYDYVLFPRAVAQSHPDFVFTPYHDVRLPAATPSALMIHDTCLDELEGAYPPLLRRYYVSTLKRNLKRAGAVLTVSETSAASIRRRYGVDERRLHVVYNACHPDFVATREDPAQVAAIRARLAPSGAPLLLYPGGADFRKNIARLAQALRELASDGAAAPVLAVTGQRNAIWDAALEPLPPTARDRVHFLGYLDNRALKQHYHAAHAVVYPSLCEGFGRVCLECLAAGVPLACSDLPVMREVAGDAAHYFDPTDTADIAAQVRLALQSAHRPPFFDARFSIEHVRAQFLAAVDRLCPP